MGNRQKIKKNESHSKFLVEFLEDLKLVKKYLDDKRIANLVAAICKLGIRNVILLHCFCN